MIAPRTVVDPLIGRTVGGRYRLIQRLGTGGMSSVYLARHVLIDRLMAIKTLRRDLARDPVQRDRFIREARAVNRINHENIVEITDFGESDDGLVYLVMEYVPGESLLKTMSRGAFPVPRAFDIAQQAGAALARAHQMGVVHRDLKPENMLLVERRKRKDFLKILDFGIAKILDAPSLTGSQQIFGTPGYIAPEYIQSTNIDGRADLYSLGVILYEMVTGALPFDYEYPGDLLVKHVTEMPVLPTDRRADVPLPVEAFVMRCLEKNPDERFRDAFHFLDELRAVRERVGPDESWAGLNEPDIVVGPRIDVEFDTEPTGAGPETESDERPGHGTLGSGELLAASSSGLRDTLVNEPPPRLPTAEYGRFSIPEPPRADASLEIEIEVDEPRSATPAPKAHEDGLLGVRRWRKRFEGIRQALDELQSAPASVDHAMAFVARTLDELEDSLRLVESHQHSVEELSNKARDFRATLGRTIDELAGDLSKKRRELEFMITRKVQLAQQREAARQGLRDGGTSEGEADAVLWELAAVEEQLRVKAAEGDEVEANLHELRSRLETENEDFEVELACLVQVLDAEMVRLEPLATSLREPLDEVEAHIRAAWPAVGG